MKQPRDDSAEKVRDGGRRHLLPNLLLLSFTTLLSLSAMELLARHYYPVGETISQLDRRYLYRYRPNSHETYRFSPANGGGKVLVTINKEGRRGDLVSMERPRIMVYGDSFISAVFCPVKQTFVWQLEQKLQGALASPPQVVNCGVTGYGPDQESLAVEDDIDRLKPQLVIVAIYSGNDFGDLMRHKIYKLDEYGKLKDNAFTLDPSLPSNPLFSEQVSPFYTMRLLQKAWKRLGQPAAPNPTANSQDYMETWLRKSREEYEEYIKGGSNNVWNLAGAHYDADISLTPGSESSQYKRSLMDRVIEKLKRTTAARSIPLMLVIIPCPIDVVDGWAVSVDPRKYPEYRRAELTGAVEAIARKYELPYINLFKPFQDHGAASLYYVVDNDHWNAAGQLLAADLVANYIRQQRLLDQHLVPQVITWAIGKTTGRAQKVPQ